LSAGVIKAGGSMKNFTNNSELIREAIMSIREGFEVCKKRGINPKKEKSNAIYYLPFFISIPIIKKVFSKEVLCMMFEGHVKHAPDEMKKMLHDILVKGKEYNIGMPILESFKRSFN
jgi:2-dehydropantoate 2-reductase